MSTIRRLLIASLLIGVTHPPASASDKEAFDSRRFFRASEATDRADLLNSETAGHDSRHFDLGADGVIAAGETPEDAGDHVNHFRSAFDTELSSASTDQALAAKAADRTNMVHTPAGSCSASPNTPEEIINLVKETASRHNVDADLALAITWTESRFDQVRNSPKGARGPMQLMPGTATRLGVADACDPASNIDGGVRYLRVLLEQFQNPILAVAAYNAGEQAVYDHGGVPPYPETVRYVASVINRQIGVELPGKRRGQGNKAVRPDNPPTSSVMGARPVTFVGGVLNF